MGEFPGSGGQNRDEVLQWWQRGRDQGRRARITEVVEGGGKLLVGLKVSGLEPDGEADRWQVLTVEAGRIVDIRRLRRP